MILEVLHKPRLLNKHFMFLFKMVIKLSTNSKLS